VTKSEAAARIEGLLAEAKALYVKAQELAAQHQITIEAVFAENVYVLSGNIRIDFSDESGYYGEHTVTARVMYKGLELTSESTSVFVGSIWGRTSCSCDASD